MLHTLAMINAILKSKPYGLFRNSNLMELRMITNSLILEEILINDIVFMSSNMHQANK
jgi:hypothetical protein